MFNDAKFEICLFSFIFGFCRSLQLKVTRLEKEKEQLQDRGSRYGERERERKASQEIILGEEK